MATHRKGIGEIRSLSGATGWGTHSKERHAYQFRIGALELERTRLSHEKKRFLERLKCIDERIAGIDREIRMHQTTLATGASPESPATPESPAGSRPTTTPRGHRTLRY